MLINRTMLRLVLENLQGDVVKLVIAVNVKYLLFIGLAHCGAKIKQLR